MDVLVFKTNIKTRYGIKRLTPVMSDLPSVTDWTIDLEDIDRVLRVVTTGTLSEIEVERHINGKGFFCQALPD